MTADPTPPCASCGSEPGRTCHESCPAWWPSLVRIGDRVVDGRRRRRVVRVSFAEAEHVATWATPTRGRKPPTIDVDGVPFFVKSVEPVIAERVEDSEIELGLVPYVHVPGERTRRTMMIPMLVPRETDRNRALLVLNMALFAIDMFVWLKRITETDR